MRRPFLLRPRPCNPLLLQYAVDVHVITFLFPHVTVASFICFTRIAHFKSKALEESSWKVTPKIKTVVAAYTGSINTTLMVEQLFGDLRKAERLLQVRWSASLAQLQAVQLRAMERRWKDSFNVRTSCLSCFLLPLLLPTRFCFFQRWSFWIPFSSSVECSPQKGNLLQRTRCRATSAFLSIWVFVFSVLFWIIILWLTCVPWFRGARCLSIALAQAFALTGTGRALALLPFCNRMRRGAGCKIYGCSWLPTSC